MRPDHLLRGFLEDSSIASALRDRGYRRSGITWIRRKSGVVHVVDFQRSRYSEPGSVRFTINLGVALEEVSRVYNGHGLRGKINEADCFPRFRVGEALGGFLGEAKDVWWTHFERQAQEELAAEVKSALLDCCLPILDRLDNLDSVFRFVHEEAPPRHPHPYTQIVWAIVCQLHGEVDKGESLLLNLQSSPRLSDDWRSRISDVRARIDGIR